MAKSIGQVIKEIRTDRNMNIQDLANASKVSRPYISQIESGTKFPSANALKDIAKGLKVSKLFLYKSAGYLDETDILELVEENKRLRKALEQIANSDGWLIEPNPLCTVVEAYGRCVEIADKALEGDSK